MEKKIWRGLRGPLCRRREGKREGEKEREAEKRRGGGFCRFAKGYNCRDICLKLAVRLLKEEKRARKKGTWKRKKG